MYAYFYDNIDFFNMFYISVNCCNIDYPFINCFLTIQVKVFNKYIYFFSNFSSTFPRFITLRRLFRFVNTTKFAKKRFLGFISYHLLLSRSYAIIYPTSNWPPHDFFYMQRPSRKISISVWSFKN